MSPLRVTTCVKSPLHPKTFKRKIGSVKIFNCPQRKDTEGTGLFRELSSAEIFRVKNPKKRFSRFPPKTKQARLAADAPICRVSPKKGMEESIYEETSNSAAFEFSRLRSSSLGLFIGYWNILAQIWRCRSDLVDFSVFFQRFSVFRFPAPQRSRPRFQTQKQGAPCRRRTLPLKFFQHL